MLYKNIYDTLKIEKTKDISTMTGLTVFHQSLLRDKRLVLAYLYVTISLSLCLYSTRTHTGSPKTEIGESNEYPN